MRKVIIFLMLLFVFPCIAFGWTPGEFMIFTYGVQLNETNVRTLADAGFNTLYGPVDKLELCREFGLKLMIPHPGVETASRLFGDPAVWGYDIMDEPIALEQINACADSVKAYRRADSSHPGFVNLNQKGGDWIRLLIDRVQPELLSFDDYQWWYGGVYEWFSGSPVHFVKLEQHRDAARDAGIPLIAWREVNVRRNVPGEKTRNFATPEHNAEKIRQSVYTTLAYGAKGILWFTGYLLFDPGTSELNETGRQVAAINSEIETLGPVLVNLRSIGVFHTQPVPRGSRETTPDHWVQPIGENLVMGAFRDSDTTDYVLIANKDWRQANTAELEFRLFQRKVASIELFDKASGQWNVLSVKEKADSRDHDFIYDFKNIPTDVQDMISYNHNELDAERLKFFELYHSFPPPYETVTVRLAPGDGELLRVRLKDGENIPDPRKQ